jgi:hypothetical protein
MYLTFNAVGTNHIWRPRQTRTLKNVDEDLLVGGGASANQNTDLRSSGAGPPVFKMRSYPKIPDESRSKAREAGTRPVPHASVDDAIGVLLQENAAKLLRCGICGGAVAASESGFTLPDVMEGPIEVGSVFTHLDERIKYPDFLEFGRAVVDCFGVSCLQRESAIPGPSAAVVESASFRSRMTERGHDHCGEWLTCCPFVLRYGSDHPQFGLDAVVGPALEFPYEFEVFGRSNLVQYAYRRIPARYQPMSVAALYV